MKELGRGKPVQTEVYLQLHFEEDRIRAIRYLKWRGIKDKQTAEDIVSLVFENIIRRVKSIDPNSFAGYFFKLVHNARVDYYRSLKSFRGARDTFSLDHPAVNMMSTQKPRVTEDNLVRHEELLLGKDTIANLVESQRKVILLYIEEGLSVGEIAEFTNKSINSVRNLKQRAFSALGRLSKK